MNKETASFAMGFQAAKGTGAAALIRGIVDDHKIAPSYSTIRREAEHRGKHQRPSANQSSGMRGSVIVPWSVKFGLRPRMIGHVLLSNGYSCSTATTVVLTIAATGGTFTITVSGQTTSALAFDATAGAVETALELLTTVTVATVTGSAGGPYTITVDSSVTAATMTASATGLTGGLSTATYSAWFYTHTFTEANAGSTGYVTLMEYLGEGAARYGQRAVDGKANSLSFKATAEELTVDVGGFAITPGDPTGAEVETDEVDVLFHPGTGLFTVVSSSLTALGVPLTHDWTQDNPIDDKVQQLHSIYRARLPEGGRKRNGSLGGLVFAEDPFREIMYAGGTEPSVVMPEASLSWSWTSPAAFAGTQKYSFAWTYPICEFEIQPVDLSGTGEVVYSADYVVSDTETTSPSSIILINDVASYAGT